MQGRGRGSVQRLPASGCTGQRDLYLSRSAHRRRRFAWRVASGPLAIDLLNHSPDRHRPVTVAIERETFDRRQGERAGVRVNFGIEYLLSRGPAQVA